MVQYRINPAFHRHADEAAIIGRLLVAFGELEYMTAQLAARANGEFDPVLKSLYRLRATSSRLDAADALMRGVFSNQGLAGEYGQMIGAVRYCLRIRNQFAHCNWGDDLKAGLFFVDLEESAKKAEGFDHEWCHVDTGILHVQEAYFVYAQSWLFFLEYELALKRGQIKENIFPKPKLQDRPLLHSPRSQHTPPWLSEDQKAQHLKRAQESEATGRSPSRRRRGPERPLQTEPPDSE